jgi:putative ABC transport system ATP-binding protein
MLVVENLTKVYRRKDREIRALDGVSLSAQAGEVVAVVGPSGSGKSTLLFTLGMMARPTQGQVTIDGTAVYEQSHRTRRKLRRDLVGFLFQTFQLLPYLTAEENVRAALGLRGWARGKSRTEAARLLDQFGLADRANHLPDGLSVGERQRVALARAMAGGPKLLLADEPTGNLDPENGRIVKEHLVDFARRSNGLVIIVTHDPDIGESADRILRLEAGRFVD